MNSGEATYLCFPTHKSTKTIHITRVKEHRTIGASTSFHPLLELETSSFSASIFWFSSQTPSPSILCHRPMTIPPGLLQHRYRCYITINQVNFGHDHSHVLAHVLRTYVLGAGVQSSSIIHHRRRPWESGVGIWESRVRRQGQTYVKNMVSKPVQAVHDRWLTISMCRRILGLKQVLSPL
jgi:hypothetical protein